MPLRAGPKIGPHIGPKTADDPPTGERVTELSQLHDVLFLLETLMENVPDSIYFKDLESRFTRINRYAAQRYGVASPAHAIGRTDFDFFTDEHAAQARRDEQEIIRTRTAAGERRREGDAAGRPGALGLDDEAAAA